ncbi:MAG: hypothetical protein P8Z40_04375 [Chloroflexota bacterium]
MTAQTPPPFDPAFDDCRWTDAWTRLPIIQVTPGSYGSFTVKSWEITRADVCGQQVVLSTPLSVRGLVMDDGTLWMSDVPQERLMMLNNAQASRGRVLVGGLGLGLYPQYALPYVESLRIVERETAVCRLVEPIVRMAAAPHGVELVVVVDDVDAVLCAPPTTRYDTIFLDIWDKLDAAHLPAINLLRDRALAHLTPGGRVLLWGYRWMVRLFEQACERLLSVDPAARSHWLEDMTAERPAVRALLLPVVERFAERPVDDNDAALGWCREYAVRVTPG